MKNLASEYEGDGRFKEVESLRIELMRSCIESFGEDSSAAITSMADLVLNYRNYGLYELEAKYQLGAFHQQTKSLGLEDPAMIF